MAAAPHKLRQAITAAPWRALTGVGSMFGHLAGGAFGGFQAARAIALASAYHDAARRDATTDDWRAQKSSADQAILADLDTMLARSRHLIANDATAASAQGAYRRYAVGGGITARAAARHPETGEMLTTFNATLDRLWGEYVMDESLCDAEGTKSLAEKQQLWMNELFAAGGLFIQPLYRPNATADNVRLLLQEIEYEQRDETVYQHEGRPVRGGIETGELGEPLAYHLYTTSHPLDEYAARPVRVPAERCHHLFRQDRVRQRCGAPWMRPVMPRVRNLAMYEQYTMVQARTRAGFVGAVEQDNTATAASPFTVGQQLSAPAPAGQTASDSELRLRVAPGIVPVLRPGQSIKFPPPNSPDSMYPPFVAEQLKAISAGCGLDFTTVARWYADGNFSSQRQAKLDIAAEIESIQDLLFVGKILRKLRRQFIEIAIREERLSATGYFTSARWGTAYRLTNWQGPPQHSIDEIKDEAAWDMRLKSLRASPQEYANAHGKDIRDVLSEWQEFSTVARDEYGLGDVVDNYLGTGRANGRGIPAEGRQPPGTGEGRDEGEDDGQKSLAGLVARQAVLQAVLDQGNGQGRGT